ncbi:MAG: hypothetical protein ACRDIC_16435, partial [bacterium]
MLALFGAALATAVGGTSPTLATDKTDYAPGEVVHITGSGFNAGESYALPVKRPDGSIVTIDPDTHAVTPNHWDVVTADADGSLAYDYQLDGIEGPYEARAYPADWGGDWNDSSLSSVGFTDTPTKITAKQHEGQLSTGAYTSGNITEYAEGDTINFRFRLAATHGPTSGSLEVRFSGVEATCTFFDPTFVLGSIDAVSGAQPTVVVSSGPTASGTEWVVVLNINYASSFGHDDPASEATVNYTLTLSDEAGECSGSSQHSRLNPAGGSVDQTGAQNVPVPADKIIELPEITVIKMIDRDANGSFESTANAGEYCFTLDSGSCTSTDFNGQVIFINVTPDGAHTITETQLLFNMGTYNFASGSGTNCTFSGSTATATVASGTTSTDATCTFNNKAKNSPTIATQVKKTADDSNVADGGNVAIGTSLYDTATLTGATTDAGGTIAYSVYPGSDCTGTATDL